MRIRGNEQIIAGSVPTSALNTTDFTAQAKALAALGGAQAFCAAIGAPWTIAKSAVAVPLTGTLTRTVLASFTVPANALGPNGQLEIVPLFTGTSSANNKTFDIKIGSNTLWTTTQTTLAGVQGYCRIANRGATISQIVFVNAAGFAAASPASAVPYTIDTTTALTVELAGTLTNTGETIHLESFLARLTYGA
jgi:hypothetical protein